MQIGLMCKISGPRRDYIQSRILYMHIQLYMKLWNLHILFLMNIEGLNYRIVKNGETKREI